MGWRLWTSLARALDYDTRGAVLEEGCRPGCFARGLTLAPVRLHMWPHRDIRGAPAWQGWRGKIAQGVALRSDQGNVTDFTGAHLLSAGPAGTGDGPGTACWGRRTELSGAMAAGGACSRGDHAGATRAFHPPSDGHKGVWMLAAGRTALASHSVLLGWHARGGRILSSTTSFKRSLRTSVAATSGESRAEFPVSRALPSHQIHDNQLRGSPTNGP